MRGRLTASFTWPIAVLLLVVLYGGCSKESSSQRTDAATDEAVSVLPLPPEGQVFDPPNNDQVDAFMAYLREHFDDVHDVIMRFHLDNPDLAGQSVVRMIWRDGQIEAGQTVSDDTGDPAFGASILEAIRPWRIPELTGPLEISIPFSTQIYGSDDPAFPECGILTGMITDESGSPVAGAGISLNRPGSPLDTLVTRRSNREGVYIMTLIPAGTWDIVCAREGLETASKTGVTFAAGEHHRVDMVLKAQ